MYTFGGAIVFFMGGKCDWFGGSFAICERGVICDKPGGGG